MLIHVCVDCKELSINRIAADDDPESIIQIFQASIVSEYQHRRRCSQKNINMFGRDDSNIVHEQLYGQSIVPAW